MPVPGPYYDAISNSSLMIRWVAWAVNSRNSTDVQSRMRAAEAANSGSRPIHERMFQIPSQSVYFFRGTDPSQTQRIVILSRQPHIGSDRSFVSRLKTLLNRVFCPMRLQSGTGVREMRNWLLDLLFEPTL